MRTIKVNEKQYQVDDQLANYNIVQKPSSNVEFFGDNGRDVYLQFKNGKGYIYPGVTKEHIVQMHAAESIGRFVSVISKAYQYVPADRALVTPEPAVSAQ